MLVLSRKKGETIMINDNIEVKVLGIEGDQVKLGIVAPKSVKIYRQEVYAQIEQQNEEALNSDISFLQSNKK